MTTASGAIPGPFSHRLAAKLKKGATALSPDKSIAPLQPAFARRLIVQTAECAVPRRRRSPERNCVRLSQSHLSAADFS
jgi:hypothetical protein